MRLGKISVILLLLLATGVGGVFLGVKHHRKLNDVFKKFMIRVVPVLGLKYRGVENFYPKKINVKNHQEYLNSLKAGFKEKAHLPKMVLIPAGKFLMGCQAEKCPKAELPAHEEMVKSFEMAVTEVTFVQWDTCVAMGGCDLMPGDLGWGRDQMPLINVSWEQMTQQFIPWLNANSEGGYHLPSEAQWEYAARDGKIGKPYPWGDEPVSCDESSPYAARFGALWAGTDPECNIIKPARVASYAPSDWGLYDILGNVAEFTQGCANREPRRISGVSVKKDYPGARSDGNTRQDKFCERRVMRGATWRSPFKIVSIAMRRLYPTNMVYNRIGFRLARDID